MELHRFIMIFVIEADYEGETGSSLERASTGGVEKGFIVTLYVSRPVETNFCVRIPPLLLYPGHVILAPLHKYRIDSTGVLFSCSLIGNIRILVVASAEVPIALVLQSNCNEEVMSDI